MHNICPVGYCNGCFMHTASGPLLTKTAHHCQTVLTHTHNISKYPPSLSGMLLANVIMD